MDLNTVSSVRLARSREDLALAPGETLLGGGTWLYSEPQPATTGLVDLMALGWPALKGRDGGLRIAATCTVEQLARIPAKLGGRAHPLFRQCAEAFLASYKVWKLATVGGNICMSLPAGPMISLATALDASLLIWRADGGKRRIDAASFVTGNHLNALEPGEVLRAIDIPAHALAGRTAFRKLALSPLGRSAAVVIGRLDADGSFALSVTASVERPYVVRFAQLPDEASLSSSLDAVPAWFDDQHGAPDWREAMTLRLAREVRDELAGRAEQEQA